MPSGLRTRTQAEAQGQLEARSVPSCLESESSQGHRHQLEEATVRADSEGTIGQSKSPPMGEPSTVRCTGQKRTVRKLVGSSGKEREERQS